MGYECDSRETCGDCDGTGYYIPDYVDDKEELESMPRIVCPTCEGSGYTEP